MNAVLPVVRRFFDGLGLIDTAALALLLASLAFLHWVIQPAEQRLKQLDARLAQAEELKHPLAPAFVRTSKANDKVARFYRFFERQESTTDWLAKLYDIGEARGVRMRSADYHLSAAPGNLGRYQLSFPVTGTYAQIRAFIETALDEIPVLSLDQVSLRRKHVTDLQVEAEVVVTLYLLRR